MGGLSTSCLCLNMLKLILLQQIAKSLRALAWLSFLRPLHGHPLIPD